MVFYLRFAFQNKVGWFRIPVLRGVVCALLMGAAVCPSPNARAYINPSTGSPTVSGVLRAFDKPEHNWLAGHRGVDLDLAVGDPIRSAGIGVVSFSGMVAGTPTISITHPDGTRTTYQPAHPLVTQGQHVNEGEVIGTLGHPFDGKPGLHWGAKRGEEYLNPLSLLHKPKIRLKALD